MVVSGRVAGQTVSWKLSYRQIKDSRAMLRMDTGFYTGAIFWLMSSLKPSTAKVSELPGWCGPDRSADDGVWLGVLRKYQGLGF